MKVSSLWAAYSSLDNGHLGEQITPKLDNNAFILKFTE